MARHQEQVEQDPSKSWGRLDCSFHLRRLAMSTTSLTYAPALGGLLPPPSSDALSLPYRRAFGLTRPAISAPAPSYLAGSFKPSPKLYYPSNSASYYASNTSSFSLRSTYKSFNNPNHVALLRMQLHVRIHPRHLEGSYDADRWSFPMPTFTCSMHYRTFSMSASKASISKLLNANNGRRTPTRGCDKHNKTFG
ncbi:hypothetical protein K523DRAFT_418627 [Schizophyllum commune Tattone D]|nr:hypothetical protein K523DRAFT_418627 [Schizophyllum commune Tattone D]